MKQFGTDVLAMTMIVGGATVAVATTLAFAGMTSSETTFVVAPDAVVAPDVNELARIQVKARIIQNEARIIQIEINRGQKDQRVLVGSFAHIDFEALERVKALEGLEMRLQRELGEKIHELEEIERFEEKRKRQKRRDGR